MDKTTSSGGGNPSGQYSQSSSSTQQHARELGDTASSKPRLSEEEREERKRKKKERIAEEKKDPQKREERRKLNEDKAQRKRAQHDAEKRKVEDEAKRLQDEADAEIEAERKMKENEAELEKKLEEDAKMKLLQKEKQAHRGQPAKAKKRGTAMPIGEYFRLYDTKNLQLGSKPSQTKVHATAQVELKLEAAAVDTDDALSLQFGEFLKDTEREVDGNKGKKKYYPSLVPGMKILDSYTLKVDFMDLLVHKKYKNLVIRIGKNDEYGWLYGAVATFLHNNGMGDVPEETLKRKVSLQFTNKKRLQDLDTFMNSKRRWEVRLDKKTPLTAHGEQSLTLLIRNVIQKHIKSLTHTGDFTKDDILMGTDYCHIYGELMESQGYLVYKDDLSAIWTVMSTYYVVEVTVENNKTVEKYPHNFLELIATLTFNGIHYSEVTTDAFREFVSYHTTLASPEAKRYLTMEFRRIVKDNPELMNIEFLSYTPSGPFTQWGAKSTAEDFDWTDEVENLGDPVEIGVYWFDSATGTSKPPQSAQKFVGKKKFKNTVWGMLDHRRCVIEHGKKHANYPFVVEGPNWTEIHASECRPNLTPYLLYIMLKRKLFADHRFGSLLEKYKSLFPVVDKK